MNRGLLYRLLLTGLLVAPVNADDTDIYMNGGGVRPVRSRIMLAVDFQTAGVAEVCLDASAVSCRSSLGEQLLGAMDLYGLATSDTGGPLVERRADGIPDPLQADPRDPAKTVAEAYWPGTRIFASDSVRAVIRAVLSATAARLGAIASHPGIEVGLIVGPVLHGFTDIRDAAGLDRLFATLAAIPGGERPTAPLHSPVAGPLLTIRDTYLEFFRYLTGQGDYASPLRPEAGCTRLLMASILFEPAGDAHPDTDAALSAAYTAGGLLPGASLAGEAGDVATAAAFNRTDFGSSRFPGMPEVGGEQNVTSHFILAQPGRHVTAMAAAGGGRALPGETPGELLASLQTVFDDTFGVSTGFVAGSVPAATGARTRAGDDVFFALFRPGSQPRWSGNIKKLKIITPQAPDPNTGGGRPLVVQAPLTDPPLPALSEADGGLRADALTYWTDPEGADVLAYDAASGEHPGRDGRSVERGGAGQQITGFLADSVGDANQELGARQLFTEDPGGSGSLVPLDATLPDWSGISDYLDPQNLMDETRERTLVKWIRGQDAFDRDGDGEVSESRRWLMGDPLHSRPLAVNYGVRPGSSYSPGNPELRLFFGANDGFFRMLRNTRGSAIDAESGRETWAFIPLELLAMQSFLALNEPGAHLYGMDGEAVAYKEDRDRDGNVEALDGDRVWVFVGQRRGGRALYAFDMTDPDRPQLKWKITHETPGFEQLAMTFSTPRIARLNVNNGVAAPALIFAGGYNGGWRGASRVGKDMAGDPDSIGNAIFVVDADSGALIWKAVGPGMGEDPDHGEALYFHRDMTDSIPSPLTVIDSNHNGLVDRAYVGDSGGNVWRIELTEYGQGEPGTRATEAGNWYVRRLASLGGVGAADRRFFHAPDFVRTRDSEGDYDGILITSGNRAAPLDEAVTDFAYLIKDRGNGSLTSSHGDLADITELCVTGSEPTCSAADLEHGWRLQLGGRGEKGLSSPLVSNGTVLFSTYLPHGEAEADSCESSAGASRVYTVNLGNGAVPPTPAGTVDRSDPAKRHTSIGPGLLGDLVPYRDLVLIPGRGIDGQPLYRVPGRTRWRAYWLETEVDRL